MIICISKNTLQISSKNHTFCVLNPNKKMMKFQYLQRECIEIFSYHNESSQIDSNSSQCIAINTVDGNKERYPSRIWVVSTWTVKYALFCSCSILTHYYQTYSEFKVPSKSLLYKYSCKFLHNSSAQSCVDIIKSTLYHYRRVIYNEISRNNNLK